MCNQHLLICKNIKIKIKINILHECKESKDVNRFLKVESTQPKFDKKRHRKKINNESTSSKVD